MCGGYDLRLLPGRAKEIGQMTCGVAHWTGYEVVYVLLRAIVYLPFTALEHQGTASPSRPRGQRFLLWCMHISDREKRVVSERIRYLRALDTTVLDHITLTGVRRPGPSSGPGLTTPPSTATPSRLWSLPQTVRAPQVRCRCL